MQLQPMDLQRKVFQTSLAETAAMSPLALFFSVECLPMAELRRRMQRRGSALAASGTPGHDKRKILGCGSVSYPWTLRRPFLLTSLGSARAASKSETASALPARAAAIRAFLQDATDAIACNLTRLLHPKLPRTRSLPPSN